jgi:hypothetical protein
MKFQSAMPMEPGGEVEVRRHDDQFTIPKRDASLRKDALAFGTSDRLNRDRGAS